VRSPKDRGWKTRSFSSSSEVEGESRQGYLGCRLIELGYLGAELGKVVILVSLAEENGYSTTFSEDPSRFRNLSIERPTILFN